MAVKAPKVETLAKSMAMLDPGYSEQRSLINEQIEGLGAQSEVKRQRLEGARIEGFNTINDQAIGRGVGAAFSGIPLHEQVNYLASNYLPGLQDIELQEDKERMQLRGTLADINTQQRNAAISRIDQQQNALNQWNLQQAQIEAQRREAELQRKFTTSERIASQNFTASQNAAARAASGAGGGVSGRAAFIDALNKSRNVEGPYRGVVSDTILGQLVAQYKDYGISEKEAKELAKSYSVRANSKY